MSAIQDVSAAAKEALRVLAVEDNPGDAILVREMLRDASPDGFVLQNADRLSTARGVPARRRRRLRPARPEPAGRRGARGARAGPHRRARRADHRAQRPQRRGARRAGRARGRAGLPDQGPGRRAAAVAIDQLRHRAQARGGEARPPGDARCAHRPAEPGAVLRPRSSQALNRVGRHSKPWRAVPGPRPLQGRQRLARPQRRRRAARRGRGAPGARAARRRHRRALRRRRVRDPVRGRRAASVRRSRSPSGSRPSSTRRS